MAVAYRADIDGLRAVAIVPVVLFHAFPTLLPGGFVGVDVFFVVSGWLIGGIVFAEVERGRFSLLDFWARRAVRLLPALLVVLAFVMAAGWALLLADEWRRLGWHVLGGVAYFSNFVLARESGYFDTAAEAKPLLHLWSLAIEEQFYLVFPLLALALARRRGAAVFPWAMVGLMAASFGYGLLDTPRNPAAAYFLPQSRAWELLCGVALARLGAVRLRFPDLVAAAGLATILAAALVFDRASPYPGWRAAVPVAGTLLVIAAGPAAWPNRLLLAHRAAVAVGLVSYPLYLWHWPLLSLARIVEGGEVAAWLRATLVAASAMLAVATYRLVERPIRFGPLPRPRAALALVAACAVVGLGGAAMRGGHVPPFSSRFGVNRVLEAAGEWDYPGGMERLSAGGRTLYRQAGAGGAVLFLGDSNIEQYAPRMVALLRASPADHRTALFLTGGGCAPIPGVRDPRLPGCATLLPAAQAAIAAHRVQTVVFGAQWWGYFSGPRQHIGDAPLSGAAGRDAALAALGAEVRRLRDDGRRVVVVLNIPWGQELDPRRGVARGWLTFGTQQNELPRARLEAEFGAISRALAAEARAAGAEVIDPLDHLCTAQACPATDTDGVPIYKDAVHLRPRHVRTAVTFLDGVLRRDEGRTTVGPD